MSMGTITQSFYESMRPKIRRPRTTYFERLENERGQNGYEAILRDLDFSGTCAAVLDLGCGTGQLFTYLKKQAPEINYHGIDVSKRALEQAMADLHTHNSHFVHGDLHGLPFADNSFDYAFAHMVFALISSPEQAAREVHRVLKPGGCFRLFTPAYWRLEESSGSRAFRRVMDTLNSITTSPRTLGIGNDDFRKQSLIEKVLLQAFDKGSNLTFEASDFVIDLEPEDALQIFSLGMYQFKMLPDEKKGAALHTLFDQLQSQEGEDGLVHLIRPMELITVQKPH